MTLAAVAAALAGLGGCVDRGPGPEPRKVDPGYVRAHLLTAEPVGSGPGFARLDVGLGGKVVYLGNKVDQTRVAPGQAVTITHYWKVLAPVGDQWRVFTLVRAPAGAADFMNLDASDMEFAYGPAKWKPGDLIEDVQTFVVRPDWRSASATILVGLIEVGRHGTLDRMAAQGPRVQDRAVVARVLEIDTSRAPPPPGTVNVPRAQGEIVVDGVADEPAWRTAAATQELVPAEGSAEPGGKASAKLLWDDANLYVFASLPDTDIYSEYTKQDDPLWKADCLEVFIDADNNRRGYVELQVSPNNVTFDSWFAGPRAARGDEEWDSGMRTAVKVNGTGDVKGDADRSWDVEIAIPLAAVKGRDEAMAVRIPPAVGDRWRMNVVRVDRRSNGDIASVASWNQIGMSDFHALDRMLTIVFADSTGSVVPVPAASAAAGSAAPAAPAPAAGSAAPAAGSAAPAPSSGSAAPTAGRAAPAPTAGSAAAPKAGSATPAPATGSAAPKAGSATPAPATGSAAPKAGSTAPAPPAGTAAPKMSGSAEPAPPVGTGSGR
jgi:hypothetical protein